MPDERLKEISTTDLQREVREREELQRLLEERKEAQHRRNIVNFLDALLVLVPEHSRTSCSDESSNGNQYRARCTRCVILHAKADGLWPSDIKLNISAEWKGND